MKLSRDQIIRVAADCGGRQSIRSSGLGQQKRRHLFGNVELERFYLAAFGAGLESAANLCEELEQHWSDYKDAALLNGDVALSNAASGEPRAARAIAAAIRRLAEEQEGKG